MVLEQFNRVQTESHNPDITSKLFDGAYLNAPWVRGGINSSGDRNAQPKSGEDALLCRADVKETPEQRADNKIKDKFGTDVFEHLNDWDWLIDNKAKLEAGFRKLNGKDAWEVASRMSDLSVVSGKPLIYLEKLDGPTRGNLIEKRYDVKLLRGRFRSDDYISHVYH